MDSSVFAHCAVTGTRVFVKPVYEHVPERPNEWSGRPIPSIACAASLLGVAGNARSLVWREGI